jgi:hypothetical protein
VAYDEELANRVRAALAPHDAVTEKAMFGGLAFLVGGNMAVGITNTAELMVRLSPEDGEAALDERHTRPFDMTGRPMRGWIVVARDGLETDAQLGTWVGRGAAFARSLPPKA